MRTRPFILDIDNKVSGNSTYVPKYLWYGENCNDYYIVISCTDKITNRIVNLLSMGEETKKFFILPQW